jgi:hypothetical protein
VGSGISENEAYPMVMEEGRKAGAAVPPASRLERWVQLQLRVPAADVPKVARVVARSIARKGIKGRHMFETGLKKSQDEIKGFFDDAVRKIVDRLS